MSNGSLTINASISNIQTFQSYSKLTDPQKKSVTFGVRGNKFVLVTKSDPLLTRIWNAILNFLHIIKTDKSSIKSLNDRSIKVLKDEPGKSLLQALYSTSGLESDAVNKAKADLAASIKKLQDDNDALTLKLAQDQIEKAKAQPELDSLQKEIADQKGQISQLQSANAQISKEYAAAQSDKNNLSQYSDVIIKKLKADYESLHAKYSELATTFSSKVEADQKLTETTKSQLTAIFEQQKESIHKDFEQLKAGLQQKIADLEKDKENLLASHEQQKQTLQNGYDKGKDELQQKLANLQTAKDQAEASLNTALKEKEDALNALKQEHETLKQSIDAKHSLHKTEIEAIDKKLQGEIAAFEALKTQHTGVQEGLQSQLHEKSGFFDKLKEESEKEIAGLKQHIEDLKGELSSKDTAHSDKLAAVAQDNQAKDKEVQTALQTLKAQLEEAKAQIQAAEQKVAAPTTSKLETVLQEVKATLDTLQKDITAEKGKMADNLKLIEKQKEQAHQGLGKISLVLRGLAVSNIEPNAIKETLKGVITQSIDSVQNGLKALVQSEKSNLDELEKLILKLQTDIEAAEQKPAEENAAAAAATSGIEKPAS